MPIMKKFVLIYRGYEASTAEVVDAWQRWFRRRAVSFIDSGNSFGPGRRVTRDATIEMSLRSNPASGYSIVEAEHIDAAEQLLEGCPIVGNVCLYEALPSFARENYPDLTSTRNKNNP